MFSRFDTLPACVSCSYTILLSNGPQTDCGRCPHLPIICAQSHPPLQKTPILTDLLNSAAAVTASEKSWIIANRNLTMHFPWSHRWTLCVIPKSLKGWLKTRIFTFCSLQVTVNISKLICGLNIASPSLQMTKRPWKGGLVTSRDPFQLIVP